MFEGEHDFRNFCKINEDNATNLVRKIFFARIVPADTPVESRSVLGRDPTEAPPSASNGAGPSSAVAMSNLESAIAQRASNTDGAVYMLHIRGTGFLWHMVRAYHVYIC